MSKLFIALKTFVIITFMPVSWLVNAVTGSVNISAEFRVISCDITAPATVELKDNVRIVNKEWVHAPIDINVSCSEAQPITTSVLAQSNQPAITENSIITLENTRQQIWFLHDGKRIAVNSSAGFCRGNQNRTCQITPVVKITDQTISGHETVVLSLTFQYG
ncbi:hypothetical protein PVS06_004227 [Escherichia coli]|nr:hypothetical protein [Escherichia coli]EJE0548312.1 hypothetical protein [Escherichia coli]EKM8863399.1 hypothetical protein [Escherichia coli]